MIEVEVLRRLERLERANLHWRLICTALVVGGGLLLGMGHSFAERSPGAPIQSLRVRELVLVDTSGKERASLQTKPNGVTSLVFRRQNGQIAAGLGVFDSGSGMLVFDDLSGKNGAILGFDTQSKSPFLQLSKGEDSRAFLSLDDKGGGVLNLYDRNGAESYSAP